MTAYAGGLKYYVDLVTRGVARNLLGGGAKPGGLGDGSPPTGSRGRAPVGVKLETYTECITVF